MLCVVACIGVGFSAWNLGSQTTTVLFNVSTVGVLSLNGFVKVTSFSAFQIGETGLSDPQYAIYDDGLVTYEGDISISYQLITNSDSGGLYYYYDQDGSSDLTSFNLGFDLTFESASFDMASFVETASCSYSATYTSPTVGTMSTSADKTSFSFSYDSSSPYIVSAIASFVSPTIGGTTYAFNNLSRINLTMTYHVNFGSYSNLASYYSAIKTVSLISEVTVP